MSDKLISQRELARLLKKSTQQIANYVTQGMPTELKGPKRLYPDATCIAWALARVAAHEDDDAKPDPKERVDSLKGDLLELELAEKRRILMSTDIYERVVADTFERVDARLKNLPQRCAAVNWSPDMTERVRQAVPLVDEVRAELYAADDVPNPDREEAEAA